MVSTNDVWFTSQGHSIACIPFDSTTLSHVVLCCVPASHAAVKSPSFWSPSGQVWQAVCCVWVQVFMVARDNGTTYNGLASSCSPVSRLASVASGCPTTAFVDCYQVTIPSSQALCVSADIPGMAFCTEPDHMC